jgi:endonuclease YncB( thermonuclease family)
VVSAVPDAATLIIENQRIALAGIDPGPPDVLAGFEGWVRSRGAVNCEPQPPGTKYRCFTKEGVDVAEAGILNGAGRVAEGATSTYRDRENDAREAKRGLWAKP